MDDFLQALFPQAPSYLTGLLGEEQALAAQKQAQQQGLLGLGLGLLQAAAPAPVRPSLGAGLAQGLASGQQAYQNVFQQRVQEQQLMQQLAEQQRQRQAQQAMQTLLPVAVRGGQLSDEALSLAAGVMKPEDFAKVTTSIKTLQEVREGPKPEYREVGGALYEIARGQPPKLVVDAKGVLTGDYANIALGLFGTANVAALPADAFQRIQAEKLAQDQAKAMPPSSVSEYQFYVTQERAAGREPKSYERYQEDLKKAGAQTIIEKTSGLAIGEIIKGSIERTNNSQLAATAANQTLQTIADIKPILKEGVLAGPLSSQVAVVARLATTLGITGQNTQELLNNTAEAMQRLASLELQAAEQMRGQGAITENERALIARAAGGNLASMTASEVNTLLNALEKTAKFKIQGHIQNVNILRKVLPEEAKPYADAFTTEFAAPVPQQRIRNEASSAARSAGLIK